MDDEALQAAYAKRRSILGDEYVDSVTSDDDPAATEFQDFLTSTAWGVWAREGPLSTRDRSLLVLAITAHARDGWTSSGCTPAPRRGPGSPTPRSTSCSSNSSRTAALPRASRPDGRSASRAERNDG